MVKYTLHGNMFQIKVAEWDVYVMYAFVVHLMKSETQTVNCTTTNNGLERMWKETVVVYLKTLPRGTGENHKRCLQQSASKSKCQCYQSCQLYRISSFSEKLWSSILTEDVYKVRVIMRWYGSKLHSADSFSVHPKHHLASKLSCDREMWLINFFGKVGGSSAGENIRPHV
jgi:hypothetical protein